MCQATTTSPHTRFYVPGFVLSSDYLNSQSNVEAGVEGPLVVGSLTRLSVDGCIPVLVRALASASLSLCLLPQLQHDALVRS